MDTYTQKTIIGVVGILAAVTLIEIPIILILMPQIELAIITALIAIPSSVVTGLIGFLAGKTLDEHNTEVLRDDANNLEDLLDLQGDDEDVQHEKQE